MMELRPLATSALDEAVALAGVREVPVVGVCGGADGGAQRAAVLVRGDPVRARQRRQRTSAANRANGEPAKKKVFRNGNTASFLRDDGNIENVHHSVDKICKLLVLQTGTDLPVLVFYFVWSRLAIRTCQYS